MSRSSTTRRWPESGPLCRSSGRTGGGRCTERRQPARRDPTRTEGPGAANARSLAWAALWMLLTTRGRHGVDSASEEAGGERYPPFPADQSRRPQWGVGHRDRCRGCPVRRRPRRPALGLGASGHQRLGDAGRPARRARPRRGDHGSLARSPGAVRQRGRSIASAARATPCRARRRQLTDRASTASTASPCGRTVGAMMPAATLLRVRRVATARGPRRSGGSPAVSAPSGPAPGPHGSRPRPRTVGSRSRTTPARARS
jgi:hypothetical protein